MNVINSTSIKPRSKVQTPNKVRTPAKNRKGTFTIRFSAAADIKAGVLKKMIEETLVTAARLGTTAGIDFGSIKVGFDETPANARSSNGAAHKNGNGNGTARA
jgi:hypothetical protein